MKLVACDEDTERTSYLFENTNPDHLAQTVGAFFTREAYRLEEGDPQRAVYGTGSAAMRVLLGAFAKRYKFHVHITPEADKVRLNFFKAMSGAGGGLIGHSKMKKEYQRIAEGLKTLS